LGQAIAGAQPHPDPNRKTVVEISLAPDVLEEFERKRATYVIQKNDDSARRALLAQINSPPPRKKFTTYYERCK
jgi:hypothetical protein